MNEAERLDEKIADAGKELSRARGAKQKYLRETVCDVKGYHDSYAKEIGFWECRLCGHSHCTL